MHAFAYNKSGKRIDGPKVSLSMAIKEGWFTKAGSKWQTMPQVMLMYRSAKFFSNVHAPDLTLGLPTADEIQDIEDIDHEVVSTTLSIPSKEVEKPVDKEVEKEVEKPAGNKPNPAASEESPNF